MFKALGKGVKLPDALPIGGQPRRLVLPMWKLKGVAMLLDNSLPLPHTNVHTINVHIQMVANSRERTKKLMPH